MKGICFGMQRENTIFLFFFSRGFLFLWIRYINYKPIWQVSAITSLGGEGKGSLVLTHFWKREVGALLPVRVSRHTLSLIHI